MATSKVSITEGTGKNAATYSFSEDAATKEVQRVALNNSSGTEIGTSGAPVRTDPTGTTAQPVTDNSGSLTVDAPVGTPVFVRLSDGSSAIATLPVSLASVPAHNITNITGTVSLPTGAATESTLSAASAKLPATLGQKTSANSMAVTIASDQSAVQVEREGTKATYSGGTAFVPAASATDVFEIKGSASKTVRVRRVRISGAATTATGVSMFLAKRSTANTSGTSTAPAAVPHDSTNAAATATLKAYTANPTTGTLVGFLRAFYATLVAASGSAPNVIYEFVFGVGDQSAVLRGTSESLVVNMGGATVSGNVLAVDVEWTEE